MSGTQDSVARSGPSTFTAMRHGAFRSIWTALVATSIGYQMWVFALGWFAVELAVRGARPELAPLHVGLFGAAQAVPAIGLGLVGGVVADRVDRRQLLVVAYAVVACTSVGLAVLAASGAGALAAMATAMALVLARATTSAFDLTTFYSALPRLLPQTEVMSGIGLANVTANLAQVSGPLAAGLLVVPFGTAGVFAADAVLAVVATVMLLRLPRMPAGDAGGSALRSLREGIRHAAADPVLRWVIVLATAVGLFGRSVAFVMPAVASTVLRVGAIELSWLMAGRGAGALIGSLVAASLGGLERRGLALAVVALAFGATVVAFSLQTALAPAIVLAGAMGMTQFVFSGLAVSITQTGVPDRLRGRMVSFYATTVSGITPLGTFMLGVVGGSLGLGLVDAISGGVLIAVSAGVLLAATPLRRHRADATAA